MNLEIERAKRLFRDLESLSDKRLKESYKTEILLEMAFIPKKNFELKNKAAI